MVSIQLATVVLTVSGIGQTVLYDFTAQWCGPCKMMDPTIQQLHSIGYPVQKVDIDQQPDLAKRFGITSVPCVVLVVNGREVNRHLGVASYQELTQMFAQAGVRPVVAVARGQNEGPRRGKLRWPRDRGSPATNSSGANIPIVSLGHEVPSPYANQNAPASPANQAAIIPTSNSSPAGGTALAQATAPATPNYGAPIAIAPNNSAPASPPNLGPPPRIAPPPSQPPAQPPLVPIAPPFVEPAAPVVPPSNVPATETVPAVASLPSYDKGDLAAAVQPQQPPAVELKSQLAQSLIAATVRLRVIDDDGQSLGSGSIIDVRSSAQGTGGEALILTCGHIFRESEGKGTIHIDLFDGSKQEGISGRLIRYDLARDIALVSMSLKHSLQNVRLASKDPAERGQTVISVGCDHGKPPTAQQGEVMAVNSFVGPPNIQVAGQPAVGRSGGGLFNQTGQLIGVCNFADPTDRAGLYAAVEVAHDILAEAGIELAQHQAQPARIVPASMGKSSSLIDIGSPAALTNPRQPLPNQSITPTEVICIVRSKNGTGTQRQVIVIEDAQPELLNRLATEQQKQQGTFPTTMDVAPRAGQRPLRQVPR